MSTILARLLAEHQRTPHHMDMCALCRDAAKEIAQPADPVRDQLVAALKEARPYIDNPHVRIKIGAALAAVGAA